MIPSTSTLIETGEIPGEEIEVSIGDARWVMRTQADLYSNRELAVVREYSTNARDAMLEANKGDEPILVTLPSVLNPSFTVQDFGVGMSIQTLRDVYTKFGNSTKRDSNEFNGMLGYGCKSAFAYTSSFQVRSVKDGMLTEAIATRRQDWSMVLKIVATSKTTESNGTKITVPVHNIEEFKKKAEDFYRFWMPGTVLVNGKEPSHNVGDKIHDNLYFSAEPGVSRVVMGNVAYRIANPEALFRNSALSNISFVAYVNNGDVEFTPSREDLKYTQRTKDALQQVISETEKSIVSEANARISAAPDHPSAFVEWQKWRKNLGSSLFDNLVYKGDTLEDKFPIFGVSWAPNRTRYTTDKLGGTRFDYSKSAWVEFPERISVDMDGVLVVCEHGLKSKEKHVYPSSRQKTIIKDWMTQENKKFHRILFTQSKISEVGNVWTDKTNFITWEDLKNQAPDLAVQRHGGGSWNSGRIKGSWDFYNVGVGHQAAKPIPDGKDLYYITVKSEKGSDVPFLCSAVGLKSGIVVIVPLNRLDKFKRDYPKVKEFLKYVRDNTNLNGAGLITQEAREVLQMSAQSIRVFKELDANKISDPEFGHMKAIIDKGERDVLAYDRAFQTARSVGLGQEFKTHNISRSAWGRSDWHKVISKYPLLGIIASYSVSQVNSADMYLYLNAAHDAARKGK